jgi:hypothetical protein
MSTSRFTARIEASGGGGSYVAVPDAARDVLGATGRTSIIGTVDGFAIVGQVMPYSFPGTGKRVILGLTKATRAAIGKGIGDEVEVELERDDRPRSTNVEIAAELRDALADDDAAAAAFDRLAPSHRRDHAQHVAEAKRPETRIRRAAGVIEQLRGSPDERH